MPEAVIVAAARSPIGRSNKGHWSNVRPDDLAAYLVPRVLEKVPQIEPATMDDPPCGCGLPGDEQGFNRGRVVSIMSRIDTPWCTVNRFCSNSLATTRMAAHAIRAGEGDIFLSVGVECVSRFGIGTSDPRMGINLGWNQAIPRATPIFTSPLVGPPRTSPSARASRVRKWTSSRSRPTMPRSRPRKRLLRSRNRARAAAQSRNVQSRRRSAARYDHGGAGNPQAGVSRGMVW